jgi:O-antigen/teichoic acid export membrane protein
VAKAILLMLYVTVVVLAASALGYERSLVIVIGLMAGVHGLVSLEQATTAVFAGRQNFRPAVTLRLVKIVVETATTVVVLTNGFGVLGLAISRVAVTVISGVGVVVLAFRALGVRPSTPSAAVVRPLLSAGLSFTIVSIFFAVGLRGGVLLLQSLHGFEAVALFSAAMVFVERLLTFFPAVAGALFPFFSTIHAGDDARFNRSLARALRYQVVLSAGLGLGISLFGPWVLQTIFPQAFHGATRIIEVLGAYAALRTIADVLNTAAQARGFERRVAVASGIRCLVNISAAAVLVFSYGAVGLAWALVAADATLVAFLLVMLGRAGSLAGVAWLQLANPTGAGIILVGASIVLSGAQPALGVAVTLALAYPLLLIVGGTLSRNDYEYLTYLRTNRARPAAVRQSDGDDAAVIGASESTARETVGR